MVNPKFIELAKRLGNPDLPNYEAKPIVKPATAKPSAAESPFILTYNDYGKELITKSNELFAGTKAEIPLGNNNEEVPNMYILKRLALIAAIYKNPQLKSLNLWPISPLQSEQLLKEGKLPEPDKYWEDLALILYDLQETNPKEAQALHKSLEQHRDDLGLSIKDLESRLLIVNAGIERDADMPHGVKQIILPGITQVYQHETLQKTGNNLKFDYGLKYGLPAEDNIGKGKRTLYMPSEDKNIGLRVLGRGRYLGLNARGDDLVYSFAGSRVNFAHQGAPKI